MDCSTPGSSVHGNLQARILEWGTLLTGINAMSPALAGKFFTGEPPGKLCLGLGHFFFFPNNGTGASNMDLPSLS